MTRDEIERRVNEFFDKRELPEDFPNGAEFYFNEIIAVAIAVHDAVKEEDARHLSFCRTGCYGTEICSHCAQQAEHIRASKVNNGKS